MHSCRICQLKTLKVKIDFGLQPVSNRYLFAPDQDEFKYHFQLGCCSFCGLVQLINPPPFDELKPKLSWINYSEPENHLDEMVDLITKLPGVTLSSNFYGLGQYEDSTLERLKNKGFNNVARLKVDTETNICNSFTIIETIHRYSQHKNLHKLIHDNKHPQVIIARDILEHAQDPLLFMRMLREMISPDGYVIFEVPDYTKTFMSCDYSSLWEEHITYFSSFTFIQSLKFGGFSVEALKVYPYDSQDYLVAVARPNIFSKDNEVDSINQDELKKEKKRFYHYSSHVLGRKSWYRDVLSKYRKRGKIALMGAGHLACHFINLMKVSDLIDFIIDDHPNKKGMLMPGSQLPIFDSSALEDPEIKLCLLSLSQSSERKVLLKNKAFIDKGGRFASIFPASSIALMPSKDEVEF